MSQPSSLLPVGLLKLEIFALYFLLSTLASIPNKYDNAYQSSIYSSTDAQVNCHKKNHTGSIYDCTVNDVITSYMHTRTISHQRYSRMMKGAHSLQ